MKLLIEILVLIFAPLAQETWEEFNTTEAGIRSCVVFSVTTGEVGTVP